MTTGCYLMSATPSVWQNTNMQSFPLSRQCCTDTGRFGRESKGKTGAATVSPLIDGKKIIMLIINS